MPNFERLAHVGAAVVTALQAGIGSTDLSCTIVLDTGWPGAGSNPFYVTLEKGTVNEEKILISNNAAGTLTISGRGMDGTVAVAHLAGASAQVCWTADEADEANQHYADTTIDNHTQYLNTTRHDITTRHTFGAALGTPTAATSSSPGDTAATGSGALAAREDHLHGREALLDASSQLPSGYGIQPPSSLTITQGGTAGTTPYTYTVTTQTIGGETVASPVGTTTTGNVTLSTTNYNIVTWSASALPAGSPGNLVYDSGLLHATDPVNPTWRNDPNFSTGFAIGSANGDFNVMNPGLPTAKLVYYGNGSADSGRNVLIDAQAVSVSVGEVWTYASYVDNAAASVNGAGITVLGYLDGTFVSSLANWTNPGVGNQGLVSGQVTVPSGVNQLVFVTQLYQPTVTVGAQITWSELQLTKTSTVQPYQPGPLFTYNVRRSNGLIGSTTALGFEDSGQAVTTDPAPTLPSPFYDSGWITPAFTNGWTNGANVGYRKIGNRVFLRGNLGGPGTAGAAAFTLPSGFTPQFEAVFVGLTTSTSIVEVSVGTAGAVLPAVAAAVWIDGMNFTVD
ncbi:MAG: hypothetical protein KGL39_57830 [Patescibacteria group bacterium]|nr:hypothetical protein [Patescibacteria group bacterium]